MNNAQHPATTVRKSMVRNLRIERRNIEAEFSWRRAILRADLLEALKSRDPMAMHYWKMRRNSFRNADIRELDLIRSKSRAIAILTDRV